MTRLREWWRTFDLLDHPFALTTFMTFMVISATIVGASVVNIFDDAHPPRAAEGVEYCQQECSTATLKLDSIELRNVGTGRGSVCHCSVREDSFTWRPHKVQWCCGWDGGQP